jgi:hypothetical protein
VPIIGIGFFIPGWLTAMGIPVLPFISELPYPASLTGIVVGVAMAIGVVYMAILYSTNPQRIRDTGKVFLEDEVAGAATPV